MRMWITVACLIISMAAISPSLVAQWPEVKTPNVPRTAAGEVDMQGPAPKTAAGKPDFTGIWAMARGGPARGAAGAPPAGGPRGGAGRGGGQRGAAPAAPAGPPVASFANVGAGYPGGLPMQPWAEELVRKRKGDNSKDNPDAHCLPMGFMQFHTHPQPRKIVQTPDILLIIYEANSGLRQIFTDGRPLPGKDADPWWYGYSVGKWDGDALVVETTGFLDRDPLWLDIQGTPLTEAAKVTEKFRRPNFGSMEIDITVDDPKAYTAPWTVRVNWRAMVDTELIEFICEERDATHYVGAGETK
ncbi:MAG TPA: hypothetical protein VFY29_09670 [Terriglobia bacterium]|nr:hypothetical protein [Terriglobia bacterium]